MPQVEINTAPVVLLSKELSDFFMGNTFQSLSATNRSAVLTASVKFMVEDHLEIGSSYSLEIPSTSSLDIRPQVEQASTNTLSNKTIFNPTLTGSWDGWMQATNETWIGASSTTLTANIASSTSPVNKYSVGDKLKLVQSGSSTTLYAYVLSVSSSTLTVVAGSDYTVVTGQQYDLYYSKGDTPLGFPQWFNWTSTVTPTTGSFTTVTNVARFTINGRTLLFAIDITLTNFGTGASPILFTTPTTVPLNGGFAGHYLGSGREDQNTGKMLEVKLGDTTHASFTYYDNSTAVATGNIFRINGFYEL